MNADLERLVALQKLVSAAHDAERRLAEEPERQKALEARLETARQRVAAAKERLTENQNARRAIEKDVALHQGRLSKFREQAMAVKTNQEYHAVQKEIGFAQGEIKTIEDKILEFMVEADDLTASVKRAEAELAAEQKAVDAERRAMATELSAMKSSLERIAVERAEVVRGLKAQTLAIFELVLRRRNGVGRRPGPRRHLHRLPRPAAAAGVQHGPPERSDHPVRQLPAHPVSRAGRRPRRPPDSVPQSAQ